MMTLREALALARKRSVALGHFNISDLAALKAIIAAAKELNVPVMIGVSEGEREFIGIPETAVLVRTMREEMNHPIYLNADHTHSLEKATLAARAGFDEIIFDASKLPLEENIQQTKAAVLAIRAINPEIVIEGEIGYIGSSSEVMEKVPEGAALTEDMLTTPEEAVRFVAETGVDVLAPAVGNMHGLLASMVRGETHKELNIERIKALAAAVNIPMTLHGGSGTADEGFVAAVKAGMTIVHVNTEIRLAWRRGLEAALAADPKEVAPYKLLPGAVEAVQKIVLARLRLFNGL